MNYTNSFNSLFAKNKDPLIAKSLTTDSASGGALIREQLERIITNTVLRNSPLFNVMDIKFKKGDTSSFNRLTSLPKPGSAMGESATTVERQSTYNRVSIRKKVIRKIVAITDFLNDSADVDFDAAGQEIEGGILSQAYDVEFYTMYGNATANQYEFDGFATVASTNYDNAGGEVDNIKVFDDMLDATLRKQTSNHARAWLMSAEMASNLSRLQTHVRVNANGISSGLPKIVIPGGFEVESYRGIPILITDAMQPNPSNSDNVIGTVTPSTNTSGGSIADDTYYFKVAPVTYDGEQLASAEVSQVTAGGNTSTITLTWTPVPGAIQYYIYAGDTTGNANLDLVKIITALNYDGNGAIDDSNPVGSYTFTTDPLTASSEVPTHMQDNHPYILISGLVPQSIMLLDLDRFQGLGGFDFTHPEGAALNGLIAMEPLAKTDAKRRWMLTTEGTLIPAFERTSFIRRGVTVDIP